MMLRLLLIAAAVFVASAWAGQAGGGRMSPPAPRKPNAPKKPAGSGEGVQNKPGAGGGTSTDWSDPQTYEPPPGRHTQVERLSATLIDDRWNNYFSVLSILPKAIEKPRSTETDEPMPWLYSIREARSFADTHLQPFVVYVCDEQRFPMAGEGAQAWTQYKQEKGGTAPQRTIFESADVQKAFTEAGIFLFVKVEHCAGNARLMEKLKAAPNTLLIVAPNGEQLARFSGEDCEPARVCRYLAGDFKNQLGAWVERVKALKVLSASEELPGRQEAAAEAKPAAPAEP